MDSETRRLLETLDSVGGAAKVGQLSFVPSVLDNAAHQGFIGNDKVFNWQPNSRVWVTPLGNQALGQERSQALTSNEVRAIEALHQSVSAEVKAIEAMHQSVKAMNESVESVKAAVVQQTDTTERLAKGNNRMTFYIIAISVAILVVSLLALLLHFV